MARSRMLYRVAASVAVISLGFGIWRLFVGRGYARGSLWELIVPLLVLRLALTLYHRHKDRDR